MNTFVIKSHKNASDFQNNTYESIHHVKKTHTSITSCITSIAHSSFQGKAFGPSRLAWMHLILWPFTISSSFSPILNLRCFFIGFFHVSLQGLYCMYCWVGFMLTSFRWRWIGQLIWFGHINLGQFWTKSSIPHSYKMKYTTMLKR